MKITNICGGLGGDVMLIETNEKTAIFDTGVPKEAHIMVENLKKELGDRKLDYIFATHTHYDHIGGVAYIKEVYNDALVLGSHYAKKILDKESAKKAIKDMGISEDFIPQYDDNLLKIDKALEDFEIFTSGDLKVQAFETIGHTRCAMSYLINDELLFVSESIGYMDKSGDAHTASLIGYDYCIESIEKCQKVNCSKIIVPHFGLRDDPKECLQKFLDITKGTKKFILDKHNEGKTPEEIVKGYIDVYYTEQNKLQQPEKAFTTNAVICVNNLLKTLEN